jgi:hypothetical protein
MNLSRLIAIAAMLLPAVSFAFGLGGPMGQVVIGQRLEISIPLQGAESASLRSECVKVSPMEGEPFDRGLGSLVVELGNGALILRTREAITQPIVSFRVHIDCGLNLGRNYQLLPMRPLEMAKLAPPEVLAPRPQQAQTPPSIGRAQMSSAYSSASDYAVDVTTTLRLISRQRYPNDANARVAFIHHVAAANPELFATIDAAFDQKLAPGTSLRMPGKLPQRKATVATEIKKSKVALPTQADTGNRGKGRLIIGSVAPPVRTTEEIEGDIERLVGIVGEQIQIQISMAERLTKLEAEVAQAKQAAIAQKEANQRLSNDVTELRDEQRRNSYIQLVLAILLGGFAVAALLLWREQIRNRERGNLDIPASHPLPIAKATLTPSQPLTSIFDDLRPRK